MNRTDPALQDAANKVSAEVALRLNLHFECDVSVTPLRVSA